MLSLPLTSARVRMLFVQFFLKHIKNMGKKSIPFSGVSDEPTKPTNRNNIDWNLIKNYDEWKDVDLNEVDLRIFNWSLALQPDVPKDKLLQLLQYIEVNTTEKLDDEKYRFRYNGNDIIPSKQIVNFTGHMKSGKTQWLNVMVSIALKKSNVHTFGDEMSCGQLECIDPIDRILWVDTEQSKKDIRGNNLRLFNLMGLDVDEHTETLPDSNDFGLKILRLRPFNTEQRKMIIETYVRLLNPDLVIIDGIRDLMHNINDGDETTALINDWLLSIADNRDVWCVIHQNPNDNKMRGSMGTELGNKCTCTFEVKKANGLFTASVPSENGCRDYAGEKGIMFRYVSRTELKPVYCEDLLRVCFMDAPDQTLTHKDIVKRIKDIAKATTTDAIDYINLGLLQGWLKDVTTDHKGGNPANPIYEFVETHNFTHYEND